MTLAAQISGWLRAASPADADRGTRARTGPSARILLVEDEALVALEMQAGLESAGHEVVGVADRAATAAALARATQPEIALVDVRLAQGSSGIDVAADLARLGVRCLFVTGNCPGERADGLALGCLHKPFDERQLNAAVAIIISIARGEAPVGRLPMGFHLLARPN